MCAKLFENPTRGSKDIERTRKCDGRTDGQTDNGAKNNMSPPFHGGDIIHLDQCVNILQVHKTNKHTSIDCTFISYPRHETTVEYIK